MTTLDYQNDVVQKDQDRRLFTAILQKSSDIIAGRVSNRLSVEQPQQLVDEPRPPMEAAEEPEPEEPEPGHAKDDGHDHGTAKRSSVHAWGDYQNGRIPKEALEEIGQGSHRLRAEAAQAWKQMRADAAAAGITLSLTDSYRTYDQQVALRRSKGHLVATADPGTSVHGWGDAVDANVKDPKALAWLNANGPRYGWIWPKWAQRAGKSYEPWHREFVGGNG